MESLIFGQLFEDFKEGQKVLRALEREIWTVKIANDFGPLDIGALFNTSLDEIFEIPSDINDSIACIVDKLSLGFGFNGLIQIVDGSGILVFDFSGVIAHDQQSLEDIFFINFWEVA